MPRYDAMYLAGLGDDDVGTSVLVTFAWLGFNPVEAKDCDDARRIYFGISHLLPRCSLWLLGGADLWLKRFRHGSTSRSSLGPLCPACGYDLRAPAPIAARNAAVRILFPLDFLKIRKICPVPGKSYLRY